MFLEDKITSNKDAFIEKVDEVSSDLGIVPDWLMIIMYFESGLNPKAKNSYSNAVGLIQFMPSTLNGMGYTTEQVYNMTNIEQLDLVRKYLIKYKGKIDGLTDLYLCVFYPVAVGKSSNYILGNSESNRKLIAQQNPIFDANSDGYITKSEVTKYINNYAKKIGYIGVTSQTNTFKKKYISFGIISLLLILIIKDTI